MADHKGFVRDSEDFVERCLIMCKQGEFYIPMLATNKCFNLSYQVREYDTHRDEEDSRAKLEELIGDVQVSLMCLALYYDLDFDRIRDHIDKQIGR